MMSSLSSIVLACDVAGVGHLARRFADGGDNVPLARLLVFGGDGFEHGAVVRRARLEGGGHVVEVDVLVQGHVLPVVQPRVVEHIFEGHGGNAARSAGEDFFTLEARFPVEGVRLVHAGNEEGAVALGQLPEHGRHVVGAADEHIQCRLGAAEADVAAVGKHCRHHGVGAAAVGEFDFDAFFLEIPEGVGDVHGRVEYGVRHLVHAHLGQPVFARVVACRKRQNGEEGA